MLKQFNIEELEERLKIKPWLGAGGVVKDNSGVGMPEY